MITRVNFSKKSLVIASQGRTVVSFAVLVVLVLALFGVYVARGYSYSPSAAALLVPFALIPTIMLTIGLSLYLALLNGVVRDIGTMLAVVVTFLMLLTPVLYQRPSPDGGALASLLNTMTEYNPMYYLVITPRELILQGTISEPVGFAVSSVAAFVIMLVALFGFHLTETRIAERI